MSLEDAKGNAKTFGEATDEEFAGQILLDGFSWSMDYVVDKAKEGSTVASQRGGGLGEVERGRPEPGKFDIEKAMDRSSTAMLTHLKKGTKLTVTISLAAHAHSTFKLAIKLTAARIIDYTIDGKDGDKSGEIDERWTFTYEQIDFTHQPEVGPNEKAGVMTSTHKRSANVKDQKATGVASVLSAYTSLSASEQKQAGKDLKDKFSSNF